MVEDPVIVLLDIGESDCISVGKDVSVIMLDTVETIDGTGVLLSNVECVVVLVDVDVRVGNMMGGMECMIPRCNNNKSHFILSI